MSDLSHGRLGKVTLNDGTTDVTILHIKDWSNDGFKRDLTEIVEFGQDEKEFLTGLIDYGTFTINGYLDPSDTEGQAALLTDFYNATKITGIKFWYNSTGYITPDTDTNPDSGVLITSYGPMNTSSADVPTISITFKVTGAMKFSS